MRIRAGGEDPRYMILLAWSLSSEHGLANGVGNKHHYLSTEQPYDHTYYDYDFTWFIRENIHHNRYHNALNDNCQIPQPCNGYYISVLLPHVE